MARPKEFDQTRALRRAILLFSRQGFAASSTDELMSAMKIGRQSMYDSFGDKWSLYLKALAMYVTASVQAIGSELEKPGKALSVLRGALLVFAEREELSSGDGCMGLNAVCEFGERIPEVTQIIRNASKVQRKALMKVLKRAKEQGEVPANADLAAMADFFDSTLAGLRMAAKAGRSRDALKGIARIAGRAYSDGVHPT
jgi:TetR/AcrR family transcriptional repressor of nem operon